MTWVLLDRIVILDTMPLDKSHNSKVDYPGLVHKLGKFLSTKISSQRGKRVLSARAKRDLLLVVVLLVMCISVVFLMIAGVLFFVLYGKKPTSGYGWFLLFPLIGLSIIPLWLMTACTGGGLTCLHHAQYLGGLPFWIVASEYVLIAKRRGLLVGAFAGFAFGPIGLLLMMMLRSANPNDKVP